MRTGLRAGFDGALARSFGRPAVVAECAAPLLRVGGWLVVSEPPRRTGEESGTTGGRPEPLRQLGLEPAEVVHEGFEYRVLRQAEACPERFPGATGSRPRSPSSEAPVPGPRLLGPDGRRVSDADLGSLRCPAMLARAAPRLQGGLRAPCERRPRGHRWPERSIGTVRRCSTWNG